MIDHTVLFDNSPDMYYCNSYCRCNVGSLLISIYRTGGKFRAIQDFVLLILENSPVLIPPSACIISCHQPPTKNAKLTKFSTRTVFVMCRLLLIQLKHKGFTGNKTRALRRA